MDLRDFLKNTLVAEIFGRQNIGTAKVQISVNHGRVRMSANHMLSATITHFSGSNVENQQCTVVKKAI